MARYRKIDTHTWGDEKFKALSPMLPSGQALWFFLLTGPFTGPIPGLYVAGKAAMAEALGWSNEAFDKAFQEVLSKGMVKADWKARLIWLPNAIKYNNPESPNVITSWAKELDILPECSLFYEAIISIRETICAINGGFIIAFDKAFGKAIAKASSKAMPNQEQEQEQEQEREPQAATHSKRFIKPTIEEVSGYCKERGNNIKPDRFIDYYESIGWKVGDHSMKDWKATVRTWEKNDKAKTTAPPPKKSVVLRLAEPAICPFCASQLDEGRSFCYCSRKIADMPPEFLAKYKTYEAGGVHV